ncbi:ferritin family protein [Roseobacter weihaiensis]|uniref:hypothetical protein n=1 Tax=Roseobacter weihaiensis TaxID=2763262 RepID=UPI001D0B2618|nr:hypothetical protein [Roseobacter sp. H9]
MTEAVGDRDRIIGGGLLRLLADILVLEFKVRHLGWTMSDGNDLMRGTLLVSARQHLDSSADEIARHVHLKAVRIPSMFNDLSVMSSVKPAKAGEALEAALREIAEDHGQIAQDAETLRVTLPIEEDQPTSSLIESLACCHRQRCDELRELLDVVHPDQSDRH